MAQQMLAYIRQEPGVWGEILDSRNQLAASFVKEHQEKNLNRIVLVGSGSSNTASRAAKEMLERLIGVEVTVVEPTRLHTALPLLPKEGLVFCAVSQSGKSTSTLQAIEAIHKNGFTVTGVTANAQSPVSDACDSHVLIACGEESVGPKTKGMTATALTLTLMFLELALLKGMISHTACEKAVADFRRSFACGGRNVAACEAWCKKNGKELASAPHMILVADGMNLPSALEGALKILETLYIPVFAYEFEEYLHGVGNTINSESWLFFLTGDTENRARFLNLFDFSAERGSHNYIISTGTPTGKPNELYLESGGSEITLPFETLFPFQTISALVSEEKGIDCDKPQFSDFAQKLNTKA